MAVAGLAQGMDRSAPAPLALGLIAIAGCTAVAVSVAFALSSDHLTTPGVHAALMNWITFTYVSAGLVAWWRRPESRFGPLMLAAGFGTFISSLSSANASVPFTLGIAFDLVIAVLFLQLFLAFPSGRLAGPLDRGLVIAGYVAAFGFQLVGLMLGGFGPDNALAVLAEPGAATTLLRIQLGVLSALLIAGVVVLALRSRRRRRSLALLVDSFALALVMLAVLFAAGALGLLSGQPAFEWIRRTALFVVGLAPLAFLAGLLQARLARSAIGDLVLELRGNPEPAELRNALARAVRDPSLTLLYWLPEYDGWADLEGRPAALDPARSTTVIDRDGEHVAALVHDASLDDEPELLDAVAAAAAIGLENARLNVELRAQLTELQGSRARIVEAGDSERRRLERNLHDGAQQRLVAVALQLRLLRSRIHADPAEAESLAETASDELAQSLEELRELARGLHPAVLEHGLGGALNALATRSRIATHVTYDAPERLPRPVELAAYFVAAEALTNVAKYAQATEATVCVRHHDSTAVIEIADDGIGGAQDARGSGLRGLADRVAALNGRLYVVSPPGTGTTVTAELPCGEPNPGAPAGAAPGTPGTPP